MNTTLIPSQYFSCHESSFELIYLKNFIVINENCFDHAWQRSLIGKKSLAGRNFPFSNRLWILLLTIQLLLNSSFIVWTQSYLVANVGLFQWTVKVCTTRVRFRMKQVHKTPDNRWKHIPSLVLNACCMTAFPVFDLPLCPFASSVLLALVDKSYLMAEWMR